MPVESVHSYSGLLDEYHLIRWNGGAEDELGLLSGLSHAVLRNAPTDPSRRERFERRRVHWENLFRVAPHERSACPVPQDALLSAVCNLRERPGAARTLLHEGYSVDPMSEGAPELEELRRKILRGGPALLCNSPSAWFCWADKGNFRRTCAQVLGPLAIPPGRDLPMHTVSATVDALRDFRRRTPGTVVVKAPGIGGQGNAVLHADATARDVQAILRQWTSGRAGGPAVVESWLRWDATYSLSFFLPASGHVSFLALAQQAVDERARFIGSSSRHELGPEELAAIRQYVVPVFKAMQATGVRGIAAVDVVVGDAAGWGDVGLPLPGGRRLCLIECNPRVNRHNRVGLVVERVARLWGLSPDVVEWRLTDHHPSPGTRAADLATDLDKRLQASGSSQVGPRPATGSAQHLVFLDKSDRVSVLRLEVTGKEGVSVEAAAVVPLPGADRTSRGIVAVPSGISPQAVRPDLLSRGRAARRGSSIRRRLPC